MALDFPANPNDNQTFDNYIYDATKGVWRIIPNVPSVNSRYQISETPPANPFEGQIWFNSTDAVPYMWYVDVDGGQWIEVGGLNGSAEPYIVSDTPPTGVVSGTQWFDTTTGNTFIYYTDSDSSQWVQASGNVANEALSDIREVSINAPTAGDTLVYNGNDWINSNAPSHNYIINGGFDIWQRGSSFPSGAIAYSADRWKFLRGSLASGATLSRQPSDLNNFTYFLRMQRNAGNTNTNVLRIESPLENANCLPLNGQDVTVSFWARKGADAPAGSIFQVVVAAEGGATFVATTVAITETWARYSITASAISFTTENLFVRFDARDITGTAGANEYWDITGVQLEAGSIATPFKRNANSIQGELAACQRYYQRFVTKGGAFATFGYGFTNSTTIARIGVPLLVQMRAGMDFNFSGAISVDGAANNSVVTDLDISGFSPANHMVTLEATASGMTTADPVALRGSNDAGAYIEFESEL